MGAFNNSKIFYASPDLIVKITDELVEGMKRDGYEVTKQKIFTGGYDISLRKGDMFKAVIGMKTALKVLIRPHQGNIFVEASIGIFGQQAVPTVISMLLFWPVLIPQIWGLVEQSKLDDKVMIMIEQSIKKNATRDTGSGNNSGMPTGFCTNCGKPVLHDAHFCSFCGAGQK